ncbi:putative cysteine-rich receptor-like protein kinase 16 [Nymphaea thermarum]|nr:putative cysteine-rich receptor-like protein kinase 16 [Nymphaea thermarum]
MQRGFSILIKISGSTSFIGILKQTTFYYDGYMAPEYAIDGQFSTKSDAYRFGVLLLEMASGLTCSGFHLSEMGCSPIGYREREVSKSFFLFLFFFLNLYGLVQCCGDVLSAACWTCTCNAVGRVKAACPNKKSAMVWFGYSCLLRFSDTRFFGSIDKKELRKYISTEMASLGNLIEDERIHELPQYSLKAVQAATNNLSEENKLGRGGFGLVYKGELNGRLVAVKTFDQRSGPGNGFMNEIILMTRLQHKNLVRLLGCCIERGEKMLIYEFMTNGSLAAFFYDPEKRKSLDWETRFNTIMGSARAILYLHRDSQLNIIHRNIKRGNVLLDEQMTAKISGFEIARIFSGDNDPITTDCIAGTYGYIAPEHYNSGQLSTKSDVYSFGILLLEIVSGQTCSGFPSSPMGCCLNEYLIHEVELQAWTLWGNGTMSDLIDPVLGESAPTSQILRCLHIGLLCIQEDPARRPTMSAIIHMLECDAQILPSPQQTPLVFSPSISNASSSMDNDEGTYPASISFQF